MLTGLAFELAYQTRYWMPLERVFFLYGPVKVLLLGVAALAWLLTGAWLKVYDRLDTAGPGVVLRDTLRQCAVGTVAVVLFEFALRLDLSRLFLGLFVIYNLVLLSLLRLNARRLAGAVRRRFGSVRYVVVVGTGASALRLGRMLEAARDYGVRLAAFLEDRPETESVRLEESYPVFPLQALPRLLERQVIDEILFAVKSERLAEMEDIFLLCDEEGVRTRVAVDFFPHANSDVYLERLGHAPLLTFSAAPHDEIRLLVKRLTDVVVSSVTLAVLSPLMMLVAAVIRLTSPGPAIFRQTRCGLNGRKFVFYKFRSMVSNAEELKAEIQHLNEKTTAFKITRDPRLTPVGRWLRKFSIDEWPQFWNVLRGDMSLVGPRPAVPEEVEQYQRWQRRRLRMRPGLTCLWAVSGRDRLDFDTWMKMDMQYIDNWTLGLDWKILLRTVPHVVTGKGAH